MKKIKLLLLDNPDQHWSKGIEVEFLVEDFKIDQIEEQRIFFNNLLCLVKPNVRIFCTDIQEVMNYVQQHKYQEVKIDPKEKTD